MAWRASWTSRRGLSLVETLIAVLLWGTVMAGLHIFLVSATQSHAALSALGRLHTRWLVAREYVSRDIQQASDVVTEVELDGRRYRTEARGDSLVLRLAAVDAAGAHLTDAFDFIVLAAESQPDGTVALMRRVFVDRDLTGRRRQASPVGTRAAETRRLVEELPQQRSAPIFVLERPIVSLSREVVMMLPYVVRFRLRNRS